MIHELVQQVEVLGNLYIVYTYMYVYFTAGTPCPYIQGRFARKGQPDSTTVITLSKN